MQQLSELSILLLNILCICQKLSPFSQYSTGNKTALFMLISLSPNQGFNLGVVGYIIDNKMHTYWYLLRAVSRALQSLSLDSGMTLAMLSQYAVSSESSLISNPKTLLFCEA